jgi:hypothetical protein
MIKDGREFIRRLQAVGLTVESTPGHYRVLREGKPLRKANGIPFTLPFSPDTIRWRRAAVVELRKLRLAVPHTPGRGEQSGRESGGAQRRAGLPVALHGRAAGSGVLLPALRRP